MKTHTYIFKIKVKLSPIRNPQDNSITCKECIKHIEVIFIQIAYKLNLCLVMHAILKLQ